MTKVVTDSSTFQVKQIIDSGDTQPYRAAYAEDIPAEGRNPQGGRIANRGVSLVIGFNPRKGLRVGDITGWADLCEKRYESRMSSRSVLYGTLRRRAISHEIRGFCSLLTRLARAPAPTTAPCV